MLFYLISAALTPIISMLLMGYYSNDTQWLIYDIEGLIISTALAFYIFNVTSYRNVLLKTLTMSVVLVTLWRAVDYTLLRTLESIELRHFNDALFLFLTVPGVLNILFRSYNNGDEYKPKGVFLVYKKPHNLQGLFAAMITSPHGSCSDVKNGVEYVFKNRVLIKRPYVYSKDHTHIAIEDRHVERRLGTTWNLFKNCFNYYKRVRCKEKKRI